MTKSTTQAVKDSKARRGITSISIDLDPGERALWDEMKELHGGRKPSLMRALELLRDQGGEMPISALVTAVDRLKDRVDAL